MNKDIKITFVFMILIGIIFFYCLSLVSAFSENKFNDTYSLYSFENTINDLNSASILYDAIYKTDGTYSLLFNQTANYCSAISYISIPVNSSLTPYLTFDYNSILMNETIVWGYSNLPCAGAPSTYLNLQWSEYQNNSIYGQLINLTGLNSRCLYLGPTCFHLSGNYSFGSLKIDNLRFLYNYNPTTFTNTQNITKYLKVPQNTILTNAYLNLSGLINFGNVDIPPNNIYSADWSDINNANDSDWSTYSTSFPASASYLYTNFTIINNSQIFNITVTAKVESTNPSVHSVTFSIYNFTSSSWVVLKDFTTLSTDTFLINSDLIKINNISVRFYHGWPSSYNSRVYEVRVNYTTNSSLTNSNLYIGSSKIWNYTNIFNITQRTNNLANSVNSYLSSCSYINSYCYVPFTFHSDTAGIIQYSDLIFNNIGFLENSQTFNPTTNEGLSETFILNLTYDSSFYTSITPILVYNNTDYNGTLSYFGTFKLISASVLIPTVSTSGTNKMFYWKIGLTNSSGTTYFNSTNNNQTINKGLPLYVGTSCPSDYNLSINFSFFYESNLTSFNATNVDYVFNYGTTLNNNIYNISGSLNNINNFKLCINSSQNYYSIGYGELSYYVTDSVNRKYYIFSGARISNETTNINLYDLESSIATSFLFTAQTTTLIPYVNYYIGLLRWYPSLNSYKVVEIGKTDSKGQTVLKVKTEDVDYRIALYKSDGTLIQLLNPIKFICQTNPCTYSVTIDPNPLDLKSYTNIQSSLTFNSNTKRFTFTWNDPSQASQTMNLTVWKDGSINSEIICSTSAVTYTGILTCDVSSYTGKLRAEVTRTASPNVIFSQLIEVVRSTFIDSGGGSIGLFIGAILLIFFALIGTISPILVVILGIVSLVPLFLLGNIQYIVLIGIGVIGGVILHFLRRIT